MKYIKIIFFLLASLFISVIVSAEQGSNSTITSDRLDKIKSLLMIEIQSFSMR